MCKIFSNITKFYKLRKLFLNTKHLRIYLEPLEWFKHILYYFKIFLKYFGNILAIFWKSLTLWHFYVVGIEGKIFHYHIFNQTYQLRRYQINTLKICHCNKSMTLDIWIQMRLL